MRESHSRLLIFTMIFQHSCGSYSLSCKLENRIQEMIYSHTWFAMNGLCDTSLLKAGSWSTMANAVLASAKRTPCLVPYVYLLPLCIVWDSLVLTYYLCFAHFFSIKYIVNVRDHDFHQFLSHKAYHVIAFHTA